MGAVAHRSQRSTGQDVGSRPYSAAARVPCRPPKGYIKHADSKPTPVPAAYTVPKPGEYEQQVDSCRDIPRGGKNTSGSAPQVRATLSTLVPPPARSRGYLPQGVLGSS